MIALAKRIAYNILVRGFPSKMGYEIRHKGKGYFNSKIVVKNAKAKGVNIVEYLESENIGGVGKRRDDVITKLLSLGVMTKADTILEIGAGTGMFMEKFIEHCKPARFEVYETDPGWSKFLKESYKYNVKSLHVHNADGFSLCKTNDSSMDMITAHGVFVYLPVVVTFQYLLEIIRVCKTGGTIIFDCFTDRIFTADEIIRFKQVNPGYDFPVVINEEAIRTFCKKYGLNINYTFDIPYHLTHSTYFILQKT